MTEPIKVVSLFSGGGGGDLGFHRAGMRTVAFCEIDAAACAVLRFLYPETPVLGDIAAIVSGDPRMKAHLRALGLYDADLVHSSSPCQDLSVAGARAGLAGLRSSLYFKSVRLWKILGIPHFLWENVCGALSSHQGRDFALVLSAIVGGSVVVPKDGWSNAGVVAGPDGVAAWRVVDLQHFGPPQRRRRVFVFGSRAGGVDPIEVLLERAGVFGDPASRGRQRQGVAARADGGAPKSRGRSGRGRKVTDDQTLTFNWQNGGGYGKANDGLAITEGASGPLGVGQTPAVVAFTERGRPDGRNLEMQEDVAYTLTSKEGGGRTQENNVLSFLPNESGRARTNAMSEDVTPTVSGAGGGNMPSVVAFDTTQVTNPNNRSNQRPGDPSHALASKAHPPLVVGQESVAFKPSHFTRGKDGAPSDIFPPLSADADKGDQDPIIIAHGQLNAEEGKAGVAPSLTLMHEAPITVPQIINNDSRLAPGTEAAPLRAGSRAQPTVAMVGIPRRLTPLECERLMGWTDDYTRWGVWAVRPLTFKQWERCVLNGREPRVAPDLAGQGMHLELSDSARYKICGNGIGAPITHWIGLRFAAAIEALEATDGRE